MSELLWPSRFTEDWLEHKKEAIGGFAYAREMMCTPLSDDTQVFKLQWVQYYEETFLDLRKDLTQIYAGVDLAISKRQSADFFAIVTIGLTSDKKIYVLDAYKDKLTMQGQWDAVKERFTRFHHTIIAIESNAYQMAMAQHLILNTFMPIRAFHTTQDKVARAQRLSRHFENGKVFMREHMTDLLDELLQFPAGAHDDMVDALGFATDQAIYANTWSK